MPPRIITMKVTIPEEITGEIFRDLALPHLTTVAHKCKTQNKQTMFNTFETNVDTNTLEITFETYKTQLKELKHIWNEHNTIGTYKTQLVKQPKHNWNNQNTFVKHS